MTEITPEWRHAVSAGWRLFWRTLAPSILLAAGLPMLYAAYDMGGNFFDLFLYPGGRYTGLIALFLIFAALALFPFFWSVFLFWTVRAMLRKPYAAFRLAVMPRPGRTAVSLKAVLGIWWLVIWPLALCVFLLYLILAPLLSFYDAGEVESPGALLLILLLIVLAIGVLGCIGGAKRAFGKRFAGFRIAVIAGRNQGEAA